MVRVRACTCVFDSNSTAGLRWRHANEGKRSPQVVTVHSCIVCRQQFYPAILPPPAKTLNCDLDLDLLTDVSFCFFHSFLILQK